GARPVTAPRVPTGMKTGVSSTPWLVVRRPQRAAPSVATTSKKTGLSPSTVPPRGMGSGWPNGAGSRLVPGHPPMAPASRTPRQRTPLQQQTRVAVGVEAIARTNRVRVRLQDQLPARDRLGNRHALGREPVVLDRRRLDGTKGPRTDVQRDLVELDAPRAQAIEQGVREVQAGGRRRHRPRWPRVHRLIALPIVRGRRR